MEKEVDSQEFENQRPNEEVILFNHQHPWTMVKTGFWVLLLIIIGLIVFLIFSSVAVRFICSGVILLIIVVLLAVRQFIYSNTYCIVTNERIINIEQSGIFSRRVSEVELKDILNVFYEIKGMASTLLNFGDITIDTSGSDSNFLVLKNFENPHFIHEKITHLHKTAKD